MVKYLLWTTAQQISAGGLLSMLLLVDMPRDCFLPLDPG
jgi:hypothetical protein